MIQMEGEIQVNCKKCGTVNTIDADDFDEPVIESQERNMGYETGYYWEHEFNCSNCSNALEVKPSAFEYPEGFLNYEEVEVVGCKVLVRPQFSIVHDEHTE